MVSIVDISDGINMSARGYHNCDTNQLFIFGGKVKVGEDLYVIWTRIILDHVGTM